MPYDRGTQLYRRKITLIFVISSGYQRLVGFSVKVTAKVNVLFNFDLPSDNILLQIAEESDLCVLILFTARVLLGELHSNMRNRLFEQLRELSKLLLNCGRQDIKNIQLSRQGFRSC